MLLSASPALSRYYPLLIMAIQARGDPQSTHKVFDDPGNLRPGVPSAVSKNKNSSFRLKEAFFVPKTLVIEMFFAAEQKAIDDMETVITAAQAELDDMVENAEEDSVINDVLRDNGSINKPELKKKLKDKALNVDDKSVLTALQNLVTRVDEGTKTVKDLRTALDKKTRGQYPKLTDVECVELLLNRKWYRTIISGICALYTAVSHRIADRVTELDERYEQTLPALEADVAQLENKVKSHLERMGFVW